MSLHIESTEEALAALKQQRVKNLAAAVSVSALGVAMAGLLLYLANIHWKTRDRRNPTHPNSSGKPHALPIHLPASR